MDLPTSPSLYSFSFLLHKQRLKKREESLEKRAFMQGANLGKREEEEGLLAKSIGMTGE